MGRHTKPFAKGQLKFQDRKAAPGHYNSSARQPLVHSVLSLQRSVGNRAVTNIVRAKFAVNPTDDQYEREADCVAVEVVNRINTEGARVHRRSPREDNNDERSVGSSISHLSAEIRGVTVGPELEINLAKARGRGQALTDAMRKPMERVFGTDLSSVRLHTDAPANQFVEAVQADAVTVGREIYFRQGAFDVRSRQGQLLIAHELTHVIQQSHCADAAMLQPRKKKKGCKEEDKEALENNNRSKEESDKKADKAPNAADIEMQKLLAEEEKTKETKSKAELQKKKQQQESALKGAKKELANNDCSHLPNSIIQWLLANYKPSMVAKPPDNLKALDKACELMPGFEQRYENLWKEILENENIKPQHIVFLCATQNISFDTLSGFVFSNVSIFTDSAVTILTDLASKFSQQEMSNICQNAMLLPRVNLLKRVVTNAQNISCHLLLSCALRNIDNLQYLDGHLPHLNAVVLLLQQPDFVQLLSNDLVIRYFDIVSQIVTAAWNWPQPQVQAPVIGWLTVCNAKARMDLLNEHKASILAAIVPAAVVGEPVGLTVANLSVQRVINILDHLQNNAALPANAVERQRQIRYAQIFGAHLRHLMLCPLWQNNNYILNLASAVDTLSEVEWGYKNGTFSNGSVSVPYDQGIYVPVKIKRVTLSHHAIAHLFNPRDNNHRIKVGDILSALKGNPDGSTRRDGRTFAEYRLTNNFLLVVDPEQRQVVSAYFEN